MPTASSYAPRQQNDLYTVDLVTGKLTLAYTKLHHFLYTNPDICGSIMDLTPVNNTKTGYTGTDGNSVLPLLLRRGRYHGMGS